MCSAGCSVVGVEVKVVERGMVFVMGVGVCVLCVLCCVTVYMSECLGVVVIVIVVVVVMVVGLVVVVSGGGGETNKSKEQSVAYIRVVCVELHYLMKYSNRKHQATKAKELLDEWFIFLSKQANI